MRYFFNSRIYIFNNLSQKAGVIPNTVTYDHLINLYASVGELQKAIGAFDLIEAGKYSPNLYLNCNLYHAIIILILSNYVIFSWT